MKTRSKNSLHTTLKSCNWAAAAAAAFAGLSIVPSMQAQIAGFTSEGPGPTQFTLNENAEALAQGRPAIVGTELLLTSAHNSEATSAFYNTAQALSNFTASFTYSFLSGTAVPADGFAFVVQDNSPSALGGGGGALGYLGIDNSAALAFDLWNNGTAGTATRSGFGASGYGGFALSPTAPVSLRSTTEPVNVSVAYRDGVFTQTLTQGAATPVTKSANINIVDRVGPTGFVGFTGGTGGANAEQKISNFVYTLGNAPAVTAAAQPIAGVPQGGAGFFGIREVLGAPGCCGDLPQTETAITGTGGTIVNYTAPVVNLYDSGGRGRFLNDSLFRTDPDQATPDNDTVNNIAVIATGTVQIPTSGMYTFGVNSDDGFRLTIGGRRFEQAFGQAGTEINANGALQFPAGRGVNDSLGTIFLAAGDYPIQMLSWEGGGGGAVELYASSGTHTAFNPATFNLVGNAAIAGNTGRNRVLTVAPWSYTAYGTVANVTEVITAGRGQGGPATLVTTATVPTVNFHDPQGSNTGSHGADAAIFPGNTAADDNNFGGYATTTLTLTAADVGIYTFMMYTDDDSRFRIMLAGVPQPLVGTTVGDSFDSDGVGGNDQFGTNGCCFDQFGHYNLSTAGTYTIEAAFHEGGGGAGFFIYGTQGDRNTFDPAAFQLLGANVDGAAWNTNVPAGLQLVPEPSALLSILAGGGMLALRRRRR